ncbi:MAG: flagellar biosynthesis protein FlhF [Burkholderiaceae bacterium]|nr:flagellar biosynthesis protein FlhF [Burkholderiaceae bacterium]
MGPERFVAASAAEALKLVRRALGPDALVLSTNQTADGVEILAITSDALDQLSTTAGRNGPDQSGGGFGAASGGKSLLADDIYAKPASRSASGTPTFPHELVISDVIKPSRNPDGSPVYTPEQLAGGGRARNHESTLGSHAGRSSGRESEMAANALAAASANVAEMNKLVTEMAQVKNLLQSHLAGNFWSSLQQNAPTHAEVVKALINAGFSPKLCADIVQAIPREGDTAVLLKRVSDILEALIKVRDPITLFDEGGVFTFIGPTGVGKTTTVAKVAARCVLRFGRNQVALLTTDTYRIGAQEQLKVFAKILGLPVVSVRDSDDLAAKIKEASKRKIVLVDTAGVGQRDTLMLDQAQLLAKGSGNSHRILVMSATTDLRTQEDVILLQNRSDDKERIKSVIVTKTDEAALVAPILDCLIRYELPLLFISNGQRVPEDLNPPNTQYLAHRAMHPRTLEADLGLASDQIPAVLADNLTQWSKTPS